MANGRVEREKYWRGVIKEWVGSGLSQRQFCDARKIGYPNFCYWRRRLAELDELREASKKTEESSTSPFIPVEIKPSSPTLPPRSYEVTLESGHQVRVPFHFEPESLDRLITLLEDHGC